MHIGRITFKTHFKGIYGPYAGPWELGGVYLLAVDCKHLVTPLFKLCLCPHNLEFLLYALCNVTHYLLHLLRFCQILVEAVEVIVGVITPGFKDALVHKGGIGHLPEGTVLLDFLVLQEHEVEDILHITLGYLLGAAGRYSQQHCKKHGDDMKETAHLP